MYFITQCNSCFSIIIKSLLVIRDFFIFNLKAKRENGEGEGGRGGLLTQRGSSHDSMEIGLLTPLLFFLFDIPKFITIRTL